MEQGLNSLKFLSSLLGPLPLGFKATAICKSKSKVSFDFEYGKLLPSQTKCLQEISFLWLIVFLKNNLGESLKEIISLDFSDVKWLCVGVL